MTELLRRSVFRRSLWLHGALIGCGLWLCTVMARAQKPRQRAPASRPAQVNTRGSMISQGRRLFRKFGCDVCHSTDGKGCLGGTLKGLYGTVAKIEGGRSMRRNAAYFRTKIWRSSALPLADGMNVMPIYKSSISAVQMNAIVAFIRALEAKQKSPNKPSSPASRPTSRRTSVPASQPSSRPTK